MPVLSDRAAFCVKVVPEFDVSQRKLPFRVSLMGWVQCILNQGLVQVEGWVCFKLKAGGEKKGWVEMMLEPLPYLLASLLYKRSRNLKALCSVFTVVF